MARVSRASEGSFTRFPTRLESVAGTRPDCSWKRYWKAVIREHFLLFDVPIDDFERQDEKYWSARRMMRRAGSSPFALQHDWALRPIAQATSERSTRHAAVLHHMCDALAVCAARNAGRRPAPPAMKYMTGTGGLATEDPAWQALAAPDAVPGLSFMTQAPCSAASHPKMRRNLAQRSSYLQAALEDGNFDEADEADREPPPPGSSFDMGEDFVIFHSRGPDGAGRHGLLPAGGVRAGGEMLKHSDQYVLPPLAIVVLQRVEADTPEPGNRLFHVGVTF